RSVSFGRSKRARRDWVGKWLNRGRNYVRLRSSAECDGLCAQGVPQLFAGLIPILRFLRHRLADDGVNSRGKRRVDHRWRRGIFVNQLVENRGNIPLERLLAREELVEDCSQTENVGALVELASLGLLRRHVGWRANDHACLRERSVTELRNTEVENFDHPLSRQHEVRGL